MTCHSFSCFSRDMYHTSDYSVHPDMPKDFLHEPVIQHKKMCDHIYKFHTKIILC